MTHYVKQCSYCGVVISQCRCPGPRQLLRGVCTRCYVRCGNAEPLQPMTNIELDHACSVAKDRTP